MAAFSGSSRMVNIRNFLVIVAICVVVADFAEEESANTHVSLGEFDLDDQCYKIAESEWAFRTRSNISESALLSKVNAVSMLVTGSFNAIFLF
jgi:hypothetical protein